MYKLNKPLMYVRPCFMYELTRGTNLMQQLCYQIISTCFKHLHAHLQEYSLNVTAYGIQH